MGNLPPKVTVKPVPPGTNVGREYEGFVAVDIENYEKFHKNI
jgi:hypothetical protein